MTVILIREKTYVQTKTIWGFIIMSKIYNIATLKGDGIGPEVTNSTTKVIDALVETTDFKINFEYGDAGFYCIEKYGTNLPEETIMMPALRVQ